MGWGGIDVGGHDVRLHFVTENIGRSAGVIDGVEE
jgi:hypothetical protein